MMSLSPFTRDFWLGILVSILAGSLVGLERQVRGKPAGIRTSILICLGTALFVRLGRLFPGNESDPARVLAQVVTGIGFLGGGVILSRRGEVHGVTSATVIWLLAAIGAAVGLGQYAAAIAYALVTVAVAAGLEHLEANVHFLRHGAREDAGAAGNEERPST